MRKKEKKPLNKREKIMLIVIFACLAIIFGWVLTDGIAHRIFGWLTFIVMEGALLFSALYILLRVSRMLRRFYVRSQYTHPVNAVVDHYDKQTFPYVSEDGKGDTLTVYWPQFRYEYRGQTYCTPLKVLGSRGDVRKEYPIGAKRTLYLAPRNPERISAARGFGMLALFILIPVLLFLILLIGIYIVVMISLALQMLG